MNINFKGKFIPKIMTAREWDNFAYRPEYGEIIIYAPDVNYNAPRIKIGTGTQYARDLPFLWANPTYALTKEGTSIFLSENGIKKYEVKDDYAANGEASLSSYATISFLQEEIEKLRNEFKGMTSVPPEVISFIADKASIKEESEEITFSWEIKKGTNPYKVVLSGDGQEPITIYDMAQNCITLEAKIGTYKLEAIDEQNGTSSFKTVDISKRDESKVIYYGTLNEKKNSIEELKKLLKVSDQIDGSSDYTFKLTSDNAQYIYFIIPQALGTATFKRGDDIWKINVQPPTEENPTDVLYRTFSTISTETKITLTIGG